MTEKKVKNLQLNEHYNQKNRHKLIKDGELYFEDSFWKASKCRFTQFLKKDFKRTLKDNLASEILHQGANPPTLCLCMRSERGRACHFSEAYVYEKHMGF